MVRLRLSSLAGGLKTFDRSAAGRGSAGLGDFERAAGRKKNAKSPGGIAKEGAGLFLLQCGTASKGAERKARR